jgi:hypothetical protein
MENESGSGFTSFTMIVSDISMLTAAVWVFGYAKHREILRIGIIPWLTFALATLLFYRLFLRRERTLIQAATFLAISFAIAAAVLFIFFIRLKGPVSYIIAVIFQVVPVWHIYSITDAPPTLEKLIGRLEALIMVLLAVLAFAVAIGISLIYTLPCAVSVFLCLIALIVERTADGEGHGRRMRCAALVLSLFLLAGAGAAAFLLFASVPVGSAVTAIALTLLRAVKHIAALMGRLLTWLASLLPESGAVEALPETGGQPFDVSGEAGVFKDAGPVILLILFGTIAAVLLAFILYAVIKFRRKRLGRTAKKKIRPLNKARSRGHLALSLRRISDSVRFFVDSIIYRNTPPGVLVHLEQWGRRHRMGRLTGETHRHYLSRLATGVPERTGELNRLSDALDSYYFGGRKLHMLKCELTAIRRSFAV